MHLVKLCGLVAVLSRSLNTYSLLMTVALAIAYAFAALVTWLPQQMMK